MSRTHALLVGIDRYLPGQPGTMTYPTLAGCVNDVDRVAAFLHARWKLPFEEMIRLTSTDAGPPEPAEKRPTYENLVAAFAELLRRAGPGDRVLIHYSGHGGRTPTAYPEVKGDGGLDESLVPYDANAGARHLRDVELNCLLHRMADKGLIVTAVLDCCHSGGATRGT